MIYYFSQDICTFDYKFALVLIPVICKQVNPTNLVQDYSFCFIYKII